MHFKLFSLVAALVTLAAATPLENREAADVCVCPLRFIMDQLRGSPRTTGLRPHLPRMRVRLGLLRPQRSRKCSQVLPGQLSAIDLLR